MLCFCFPTNQLKCNLPFFAYKGSRKIVHDSQFMFLRTIKSLRVKFTFLRSHEGFLRSHENEDVKSKMAKPKYKDFFYLYSNFISIVLLQILAKLKFILFPKRQNAV